ncbi:hypothetical protein CBR_g46408 [Chara braunii]|uniref:Uncharacterized protein n=1 Tax=Chara braunii TaxID=69332 RepID=A0A388M0E0_CHABU|nr:hypothetical protein CBR_g46408 [Chara braunii]|eukprot:GBG88037.1 hypothetical protein CBR_g46408 [Chara braunii]
MQAEVRLSKEIKAQAQTETIELCKKLTGKTPCPSRSNLRASFEAVADSEEDDDDDVVHLTRNVKASSTKGQASRMVLFEKTARRKLKGLRTNQIMKIYEEEGVQFVTIKQAIDSIVEKRLDNEFKTDGSDDDPKSEDLAGDDTARKAGGNPEGGGVQVVSDS